MEVGRSPELGWEEGSRWDVASQVAKQWGCQWCSTTDESALGLGIGKRDGGRCAWARLAVCVWACGHVGGLRERVRSDTTSEARLLPRYMWEVMGFLQVNFIDDIEIYVKIYCTIPQPVCLAQADVSISGGATATHPHTILLHHTNTTTLRYALRVRFPFRPAITTIHLLLPYRDTSFKCIDQVTAAFQCGCSMR